MGMDSVLISGTSLTKTPFEWPSLLVVVTVANTWEDKFGRTALFWLVASEGSALGCWVAEVCIGRDPLFNGG